MQLTKLKPKAYKSNRLIEDLNQICVTNTRSLLSQIYLMRSSHTKRYKNQLKIPHSSIGKHHLISLNCSRIPSSSRIGGSVDSNMITLKAEIKQIFSAHLFMVLVQLVSLVSSKMCLKTIKKSYTWVK